MRIDSAGRLDDLDWSKGAGLIPVVAQDARDGRVLMVAWTDRQAAEASLRTGEMHFWSRSRQELWRKGATSGNVLRVVEIHADCDADTLLAAVIPAGPACHRGTATCFEGALPTAAALDATIARRADQPVEGSYTARLLGDRNLRLKKLTEEAGELVLALADDDRDGAAAEAADLLYHVLVACRASRVGLAEILDELDRRRTPR